jgi:hypothetical protein
MTWYLFIRQADGDVVSEGSRVPSGLDLSAYEVRDVGERIDWSVVGWNPTTRQTFNRPPPILIDRLDDIQARFLADPDFSAVWNALSAARKTQLRTGIQRVLASIIGTRRFRQESEVVELD